VEQDPGTTTQEKLTVTDVANTKSITFSSRILPSETKKRCATLIIDIWLHRSSIQSQDYTPDSHEPRHLRI
jgi:hypothetical protein